MTSTRHILVAHSKVTCSRSQARSVTFRSKSNPFNPLALKKSQYITRRSISAAYETSFLDRSQRHLLINVGTITAFPGGWYYNRVSRCQTISSVECMWILHKLVYKVWPNFSLEFGDEIGYSRIYAQWHISLCVHDVFTAFKLSPAVR
jgi:hypothetical protein